MVGSALIHQHTVISLRYSYDIIAFCRSQQYGQILYVILICLHMIGVAGVASHGDSRKLSHKMILQPGADYLFGIIKIFRADKTNHGIQKKGTVMPCKTIASGLHGHLIPAIVGIR